MPRAPIPDNEHERIAALLQYQILDTEAEEAFDDLTQLASRICGVPIALITLIDHDRQWFKSKVGLTVSETSRDSAFCAHAIMQPNDIMVVPDPLQDPRFADNPLVMTYPNIRFYAGAPLVTPQGLPLGTLCVIDRVPRNLTDAQLEALEALSRQVISQLELRHSINRLAQVNTELDRATQLKDEFLANMSHELRSPLNAILGMSESLHDEVFGPLNERQKKMISTVESSGRHLLELINDILDLSKIESGKLDLEIKDIDIRHLCEDSLTFIRQVASNKRIRLSLEISNTLETCQFDERRMRQVLINLLSNAVKFTPDGGNICLEVAVKQPGEMLEERSGDRFPASTPFVCIAVRDNGIGISRENQERLFQPFIQIDGSLNRQYQGTGLGLALSQRIANLHEGWITLNSRVGEGSCFTVYLPQPYLAFASPRPTPASPQESTAIKPSKPLPSGPENSSPLILLAEDNEANQETLLAYLENKGYQVVLAHDGYEAVAIAQAQNPDLILMDIQMPGIDGLEAIRQIREHPPLKHVPIIALTALTMPGDRDRCLEAGADEYISKPVQLKALVAMIETLLGGGAT
ncbi:MULTISPECIES: hybrid sensor histidine kinase/response regulator [unclassified Leptolyngbya]|uniref:hybrid sensor histidine kinase/response regulator n=1 Tax=unclassified Leptolyngbya TaxID=2650499 RepID=UPI0016853B4E|nr:MULTISPECIES: hybrid sensor histidine kinase/response regulator [unclassified Leptolyngbya]MBD1912532.1 response regulator [Leptolyngbya sp. FACHB-8]MBD2156457.1 response regulator [Leptolyngbya sp. FACHB-16]